MGWEVGDRIALAPTTAQSSGTADARTIKAFGPDNTIEISAPTSQAYEAELTGDMLRSAEVVHLSRNVVITGDDFAHATNCDGAGKTW